MLTHKQCRTWLARGGVAFVLAGSSLSASALDLLESYRAGLAQDAEFQAAKAALEARREEVPMARAQLLPNVGINATRMQNDLTTTQNLLGQSSTFDSNYDSKNYSLSLRQPLYRPMQFAAYEQSFTRLASAEAAFEKAKQDLAVRVATAYFNLLLAEEGLRQVEIQKSAIEIQLSAASLALKVGHGTRTDVDDAQARLDLNTAKRLAARQQVRQARHELEILIDRPVQSVASVNARRLELAAMEPASLDDWLLMAETANPELRDMKSRVETARFEVDRASSGHKPTLDLIAQRTLNVSDNVTNPNSRYLNNQIGVQLSVPLYAGGYVNAQVRSALASLAGAEQAYESARRKLSTQVRKEFQGVEEGILRVKALEQAERSADQSVYSNEKGFKAGTRSRVDILNAEESRGNTRLELVRARFEYVLSRIRLLALCGVVGSEEIEAVNRWLGDS